MWVILILGKLYKKFGVRDEVLSVNKCKVAPKVIISDTTGFLVPSGGIAPPKNPSTTFTPKIILLPTGKCVETFP